MRVVVSGATGFVGHAVSRELLLAGHELVVLSRNPAQARDRFPYPAEFHAWDPNEGPAPLDALRGADAVISLAGDSIAEGRWTEAKKTRIRESRVQGTRNLLASITALGSEGPKIIIGTSATGYYGDRQDEELTEASAPGEDFLAQVCADWERELIAPSLPGARRVALRLGVVLGRGGGALEKMLPIFRSGLGGRLGAGKQWMSWIHLEDLARIFVHVLSEGACTGVYNAVAPVPVRNRDFTKALARAVGKPAIAPAPAFVLRAVLGEMSQALLGSQKVGSELIQNTGFRFRYPKLEEALTALDPRDDEFFADQWVARPKSELWTFFSAARNLEEITPSWLGFRMTRMSTDEIGEGTLIDYRLKIHGAPVRWRTRIEEWAPGSRFVDTQLKGPYARWHHTHTFHAVQGGTLVTDRVRYCLPLGMLGNAVAGSKVRKDVMAIFAYRRQFISRRFTA